jgi:hypothetical protein
MLYEISLCRTLSLLSHKLHSRRIHLHTDYGGVAHSVVVGEKGLEPASNAPKQPDYMYGALEIHYFAN